MIKPFISREFSVLGMGEVMLRLSPIGKERISHSETFEKNVGGSELNVVSGISMLGMRTGIITKLPQNEIGKFAKHKIRYSGTSDDYVVYDNSDKNRLGIYYYESGAYPRIPIVLYDRKVSSFTSLKAEELPDKVYEKANVFHTSGITLALGEELKENALNIMKKFSERGSLISFDVNYRASLWSEQEARETILRVLPYVNILFVSEETQRRMFGMSGTLKEMQKELSKYSKNLEIIASTRRKATTPTKHSFSSVLYDCKEDCYIVSKPYKDIEVVDRIGSGDAYVAGALYALLQYQSLSDMAKYGDAMAALKNTVSGDITKCDISDINRIIKNHFESGEKPELMR